MQRDPELMVKILKQISDAPRGILHVKKQPRTHWYHQLRLLQDVGHVACLNESEFRVTNDGYDFLAVIRRNDRDLHRKVMINT